MPALPSNVQTDFEAWAHLAARLRLRTAAERGAILRDLGLLHSWDEIHETWSRRLNQDIAAGRMELPHRYARICAKEAAAHAHVATAQAIPPPATAPLPTAAMPQSVAPQTAPMDLGPYGFRAALTPIDAPPAPAPGQAQTFSKNAAAEEAMVSAIKAKEAVEHWSVERYARLCAELGRAATEDQRQAIWHAVGVTRPAEQQWVQQQWGERLAFDPALFAAWTEAMARA